MRKIIMFNHVSADGYFADETGGLSWSVPDDELDQDTAQGLPRAGTMLFGRKTYDLFESFWPHATDEDPHAAGRRNSAIKKIADFINQTPKIVFSRTKQQVTWTNSRLVNECNPEEIQAMKRDGEQDILVFGSGSLVSFLSQHRLIDEYRFVVDPLLLGKGQPMLRDMPESMRLELQQVKPYKSGNVLISYVKRQS